MKELEQRIDSLYTELKLVDHFYSGDSDTKNVTIEEFMLKRYPNLFSRYEKNVYKIPDEVYKKIQDKHLDELSALFDKLVTWGENRRKEILSEIEVLTGNKSTL